MDNVDPLVWASLLVVAGFAILVMEVLLPTGGVLGVVSAASLVGAIFLAFSAGGPTTGFTFITIVVVLAPAVLTAAFRYLPYTPVGRALLGEAPKDEDVLLEDPRQDLALYLQAAIEARRGAADAALSRLREAIALSPDAAAQARFDADFESLFQNETFRALTETRTNHLGPARRNRRPRPER